MLSPVGAIGIKKRNLSLFATITARRNLQELQDRRRFCEASRLDQNVFQDARRCICRQRVITRTIPGCARDRENCAANCKLCSIKTILDLMGLQPTKRDWTPLSRWDSGDVPGGQDAWMDLFRSVEPQHSPRSAYNDIAKLRALLELLWHGSTDLNGGLRRQLL